MRPGFGVRNNRRFILFWVLIGVLLPAAAQQETERLRYANRPDALVPYPGVRIYKDIYARRPEFRGGGRDLPEPDVATVRIGFIGPLLEEDHPLVPAGFRPGTTSETKILFGRHMLRGVRLAVDEANEAGGHRGKPFELVLRTDLVQWGQTSNELVKFAYEDEVWAVISSIDSNHSHVLNRATLKAEVPLVNAGSSDPTLTEHNIPWLVRCMSDDRSSAYELLNYILRIRKLSRIAVLRVNDRDGRVGIDEFVRGARRLGAPVKLEMRFENGDTDFADQLEKLQSVEAEVIVLWANPAEAAGIMRQLRGRGMRQLVVGFDRMAHPLFLEKSGDASEGVVVASSFNPDRPDRIWQSFRERYRRSYGEDPDTYAAHGYDAMQLIVTSMRTSGLNRARLRDVLYGLQDFPGVTGEIVFDRNMNDVSRPWLAEVKGGRFHYFQPEDWKRDAVFPAVLAAEGIP